MPDWSGWIACGMVFVKHALAGVEPLQVVWIGACWGSACSVWAAGPQPIRGMCVQFVTGVGFSLFFVRGIDHFDPASEAFAVGLTSGVAVPLFQRRFPRWVMDRIMPSRGVE